MNNIVKQTLATASDLTTAGIVGGVISLVNNLPSGVQGLVTLGLPALACTYNVVSRIKNEKIQEKDYEKLTKLVHEIKQEMKTREIEDLNKFVNFDISTEEYAAVEELVREAINSKGIWIRKLSSSILVTVGSEEENNLREFQRCIKIIKELDDLDIRLLILHININYNKKNKYKLRKEYEQIQEELINDDAVYAQSIKISSERLSLLGLVSRPCSRYTYDDNNANKIEMIQDFITQNHSEITPYLLIFQRFINGTLR